MTVQQAFELALQHHRAGRLADAEAIYWQILTAQPNFAVVHNNLGIILAEKKDSRGAIAAFRHAVQFAPDYAPAHFNLGNALKSVGQFEDAISCYRHALQLQPLQPEAENNLGVALVEQGGADEAIAAYRRALDLKPDYPEACNNLGSALRDQGLLAEAITILRRALELNPGYAQAYNNLGNALRDQAHLDEAIAAYQAALKLEPGFWQAESNLGNALKDQGDLDGCVAAYRGALECNPDVASTHSNLIYALLLDPSADITASNEEKLRWNRCHGAGRDAVAPHANEPIAERRLRIGYVSPDFRDHVVGRNLLPLFHHHADFEIVCYSGTIAPDKLTAEFRQRADRWRSTVGVADDALAEMVRKDGVDILVDLTQHLAGNRLPVFARRPAPVQLSFAGYPASTGVDGIGYRISDGWMEKGQMTKGECLMTETGTEQVFLIDSFWCYDPCGMEVEVNALPAQETGTVTFGSLNNFCKVNEPLLKLWARVLGQMRGSRLVLLSARGSHRQRTLEFLAREGVEPQRVEFAEPCPRREYLELYRRLDIVLDTFPYNGHTTSLDALWMGVPVVSLCGERTVSRAGLSQLSNLGLPELVACSEDDYVNIAVELANDLPRLAELRRTLRGRMEASVLMDAPCFARQIEAAYRTMWRLWCAEETAK